MSIETDSGHVFECPDNVNGDVRNVCGGGPPRVQPSEYAIAVIGFATPPRVLDIGANVGAFSYFAAKTWPGCTIDAYEPNPEALHYLEKNVARFAPQTKVHRAGVREKSGRGRLLVGVDRTGGENICCSSFIDIGVQKLDKGVDVDVIDAADLPFGHVVKVDTEGLELEILTRYLATHDAPILVLLEAHSRSDRRKLETLLETAHLELVGARISGPNIGTFAFLNQKGMPSEAWAR